MDLLSRHGYRVDDRHLSTKEMTDAFKAEHDVRTTPQIYSVMSMGGFDALKVRLGYKVKDPNKKTYGLRSLFSFATHGRFSDLADEYNTADGKTVEWFIALSMCRGSKAPKR